MNHANLPTVPFENGTNPDTCDVGALASLLMLREEEAAAAKVGSKMPVTGRYVEVGHLFENFFRSTTISALHPSDFWQDACSAKAQVQVNVQGAVRARGGDAGHKGLILQGDGPNSSS